ncbi:MAG: methyltransferase type 11 [Acidobacteria bacterium]|nr:MAG: methyltransferase type 11 [Acidobacteriota bacterium]
MPSQQPRGFEKDQTQAQAFAQDKNRAREVVEKVVAKAYEHRTQLRNIWESLMSLCRMLRAWARGDYKGLPWKTIVMAMAAALYFLDPLDIIPDFIPGIGYLDDAVVLGFVVNSIRSDLERFLQWESKASTAES